MTLNVFSQEIFSNFWFPANIIQNGPADMLSYMKRLNLPIAYGENWNEDSFDVQTLFNYDLKLAFDLFFDMKVTFYSDRVHIIKILSWKIQEHLASDMLNLMKPLNVKSRVIKEAVKDFTDFLEAKLPFEAADRYLAGNPEGTRGTMKDLLFSQQRNNWKTVLKNYLMNLGFNASENISMTLHQPKFLQNISDLFERLSKR